MIYAFIYAMQGFSFLTCSLNAVSANIMKIANLYFMRGKNEYVTFGNSLDDKGIFAVRKIMSTECLATVLMTSTHSR